MEGLDRLASDLLERVAGGDQEAFGKFAALYQGLIYSGALKVLRNREDALDVTQDILLKVWTKAKTYNRAKGRPLTWVATMTRNRAIDRMRTFQSRDRLRDRLGKEAEHEPQVSGEVIPRVLSRREEGEIVKAAVTRLTPEQRQVVEMCYFSGLTQSEIADCIGAPLGTVKARLRRGIARLRTLLSPALVDGS
ncbi:MAG: sigma-70 family RNA polymerase sigma factor [Verrucomicrobiales bacterium]